MELHEIFITFNIVCMTFSCLMFFRCYSVSKKCLNILKSIDRNTRVVKTDVLLKRADIVKEKAAKRAAEAK